MGWSFYAYADVGAATDADLLGGRCEPCAVDGATHAFVRAAATALRWHPDEWVQRLAMKVRALRAGESLVLRREACLPTMQGLRAVALADLPPEAVWVCAQLCVLFRQAYIGGAVVLTRHPAHAHAPALPCFAACSGAGPTAPVGARPPCAQRP